MRRLLLYLLLLCLTLPGAMAQQEGMRLVELAKEAETAQDFGKALAYYVEAKHWYEQYEPAEQKVYARCLHGIGRAYLVMSDGEKALEYTTQALEIRKSAYGELSEEYLSTLNNVAFAYDMLKDRKKAIEVQEQVCRLMEQMPTEHKQYADFMYNMGRYYFLDDNKEAAAMAWEKALPKVEKYGEMYEQLLKFLGYAYDELKDNKNLRRIMRLTDEHNEHELTKPCDDAECLLGKAEYYTYKGKLNKAKETYLEIFGMEMNDLTRSKAEEAYARLLHVTTNDYAGAADYYTMAAESTRRAEGENERYYQLLFSAATHEFLAKNAHACIDKAEKVRAYYLPHDSDAARKNLAMINKTLGNAYKMLQDYRRCLDFYEMVLSYRMSVDRQSSETADILMNIAFVQRRLKDYDAAIEADERALMIYKALDDAEKCRSVASDLSLCYTLAGRDESAELERLMAQGRDDTKTDELIADVLYQLPLLEAYAGELDYASSLATLAGLYYMKDDYAKAMGYYGDFMDHLLVGIRDQFRMLDVHDRVNVWGHIRPELRMLGELSCVYPADDVAGTQRMAELLYDAQLLSKGILLNSSIAFSKVLRESGNMELMALYEQLKEQESQLTDMRQRAATEDDLKAILQLQQEMTAKQIRLYDACAEFADYTEYMGYRWKDVQRKLGRQDVAIEFVSIAGPEDLLPDERTIFALVIDTDGQYPTKVRIGKIRQLRECLADYACYTDEKAGAMVWGNLLPLLRDKERVYFAADALLNSVGIEYLQVDGKPMSERYAVYRLSSTKELCYQHRLPTAHNIVLMGDMDYGQTSSTMDDHLRSQLAAMRGLRESEGGFDPLPYTQQEIEGISRIYQGQNAMAFVRQQASELALRSLTEKKVSLLHISTHGVYMGNDKSTDEESMALSVLAMSGANEGSDDPDNDGIISAADIATLNLRDCDLAVLSACQTGLGYQGDDGVFGLQRGFKNAGVHTLLMTLASVYDESTAMLMEHFHQELSTNPRDKRTALIKAQQYLRSHGYDAPQYWAAFILLDAID